MKPRYNPFIRHSLAIALLCATAIPAAAQLQWDSNTTTSGISDAAGAWNGTEARWWNGSTNVVWADNSDAQFGTGTLGNAGNVTIGTIDPTVNSITFNAPSGTGNFNITGRTINLLNTSTDITANSGDHTITSSLAGSGKGINKKGTAQVRLAGAISYTGATTITAGTLRVNSGANTLYSSTSSFFMAGGSLVISAGSTQNIAKDFTFSSASGDITTFDGLGNTGHALGGTMTINNSANMNIRPRNTNAGATMVNFDVTGKITGAGNFRVAGNGSDLAAAAAKVSNTSNDYSGTTTIGGARLVLGNSGVIPNGSTVTMSLAGSIIPSLDLNGNNETIAGLSSTATGAVIFNNSGAGTSTLTVGSGGATAGFAGVIKNDDGTVGGTVALTKTGNGTQTLSGTNTYTGGTTVSGGSLVISGNSSSANGAVSVDAGSLYVSGQLGGNVTIANGATIGSGIDVSVGAGVLGGTLTLNGTSKLDLTNFNSTADLSALAISFATTGFGVDNLTLGGAAINWDSVVNGTYTLIAGTLNSLNLDNFGYANRVAVGSLGREAYFQNGSLQLVVIPEPSAALLGGLGALLMLRRRRA